MTVCLVSSLTICDFVESKLTLSAASAYTGPQVGVLSLAAVLFEKGLTPSLIDLDQMFLDHIRGNGSHGNHNDFFNYVARHLENLSYDVFGFSSICSSYPLTVRLARAVKRFHPQAQIVLGGPQASVVDVETLEAFPFVDLVVRGEAEVTLPLVLDTLSGANSSIGFEHVQGITFRRGRKTIRNPNAPVIRDLDAIPLPAYNLDPHIGERGTIHLEAGRGCPYACSFCSTNDFFRRNFRLKSTEKMIEHMAHLKDTFGIYSFSLVHDMYTVNRRKVVEFCEALIERGEEFYWTCSARTDRVDDELLALMAEAGCCGIFFGIESGSQRLQHIINKKVDLEDAWGRIWCASRHGMNTAVALITGFPDEKREDLRDTINYYVNSTRYDNTEPQLSLLAPLAATQIYAQCKEQLVFDHIFSDISHQSWRQDQDDIGLIKAHPEIFPNFYSVPTRWIGRKYFSDVRDFVMFVTVWFRWLPIALLQDSGDFLVVFDQWMRWRSEHGSEHLNRNGSTTPYYNHRQFPIEFVEFVRSYYLKEMATEPRVLIALTQVEGIPDIPEQSTDPETFERLDSFRLTAFPYRPAGVRMIQVDVDYNMLIQCLRDMGDLRQVPTRKVTIAFQLSDGRDIKLRQLKPLSSELLCLCDGSRSVKDIMHHFSHLRPEMHQVPGDKVCLYGLSRLLEQQLIVFSSRPLEENTDGVTTNGGETRVPEVASL